MKNCDFVIAKTKILNGEPITDATFKDLCKLKKTYCDGIAEELSKPTQKCDNGWLAKMARDKSKVEDLIRMAKVS